MFFRCLTAKSVSKYCAKGNEILSQFCSKHAYIKRAYKNTLNFLRITKKVPVGIRLSQQRSVNEVMKRWKTYIFENCKACPYQSIYIVYRIQKLILFHCLLLAPVACDVIRSTTNHKICLHRNISYDWWLMTDVILHQIQFG